VALVSCRTIVFPTESKGLERGERGRHFSHRLFESIVELDGFVSLVAKRARG